MNRIKILLIGIAVAMTGAVGIALFTIADAEAHWPYSTSQVEAGLRSNNVGGYCGRGTFETCYGVVNVTVYDRNGDGALRYGAHSYQFYTNWWEYNFWGNIFTCHMQGRANAHYRGHVGAVYTLYKTSSGVSGSC